MRPRCLVAHTGLATVLLATLGCGTVTSENDDGGGAAGTGSGAAGTGSGAAGTGSGAAGTGGTASGGRGGAAGTGIGAAGTGGAVIGGRGGAAGTGSGAAGTGGSASGGRGGVGGTAAGGRGGTLGTGGIPTGGRGGSSACPVGGCPALAIADLTAISTATAPGFDAPGFRCKSLTVCGVSGSCVYFSADMFGSKQSGEDSFQDGAEAAAPMPVKMNIDGGAASQCNNPAVTFRATEYVTLTFDGGKQLAVYLPAFTGVSLTLYIASDGSTYHDAARTMPAGRPPAN